MRTACPTYATEAMVSAAANAPITKAQAQNGKAELAKMKSSLTGWLKYRSLNNQVANGVAPKAAFRRPGLKPVDPRAFGQKLSAKRFDDETALAQQLHALLSEVFDAATLPAPDVAANPDAAVELAKIAIAGKLPGEAPTPSAQGFVWLWPLVIVVGAIAFIITTKIRNDADVAKEKERLACIEAGACTDSGFFLKLGAIVVGGWIVWDKFGVGAKVKHAMRSKGGR